MEQKIKIGKKSVALKATASTVRRYRAKFGRDLFADMQDFTEGKQSGQILEAMQDLTYIMAKQADDSIPDDINEWLDSFDSFPIAEFAPAVVNLWMKSSVTTVEVKN